MARGRGGSRPRGRGRGGASRGRGGFPRQRRSNFQTSRIEDIEGGFNGSVDSDAIDDDGSYAHDEDQETEPESDEDVHPENSYSALLHALRAHQPEENLPRKRRKLSNGHSGGMHQAPGKNIDTNAAQEVRSGSDNSQKNESHDLLDVEDDEVDTENDEGAAEGSSGDEDDPRDPFEQQYGAVNEHLLVEGINAMKRKEQVLSNQKIADGVSIVYSQYARWPRISRHEAEASIKKRLIQPASQIANTLSKVDDDLRISLLSYRDVLYGCRNLSNAVRLRDTVSLHAINHIFKTRDRVIKNNAKLSQQTNADLLDVRDQGFTRPKVLVLLPTRQACIKFIESVVRSSQPEQQENKSRFTEGFAGQDDKTWEDKPEDFQDLFGGNDDDMFRLGLKFTRKTIKYFSAFYNSDIILASPLGLMRAIEGGKDKDEKKKQDADFLSSIEIAIVDHTNALLMQNWQHVEHIFSQLNLLPKESHGCDFSRVRNWYLDGHSKYLRQTIILSDYLTPEINSLSSKHLLNIAGRVKYTPHYNGAMLHLPPTLPTTLSQSFTRFTSSAPMADHDARFAHFTATILPSLLHHKSSAPGTLIYMPIYVDFVRLRNHLSTTTTLSFGSISEYSSVRDVARARSHFLSGRHSVLIYAERAHHFRRYAIRGVKRVVFYGVPENPIFWGEVVGFLGGLDGRSGRGAVRAIFSKWDVMKLERIVGTERVGKLLSEKGGDTFEFA